MARPLHTPRRLRIGLIALTIALTSVLTPSAGALAGFSTSPGTHGVVAKCTSGTHVPEAALVLRKSGEGQKDYT